MASRVALRAVLLVVVLVALEVGGCTAAGIGTGQAPSGDLRAPAPGTGGPVTTTTSTSAAPAATAPPSTAPPTTAPPSTAPAATAPPSTAPAGADEGSPPVTLLRPGSAGSAVLSLQQHLTALGYWLGTPDGRYGTLTAGAVVALQKAAGLSRDGIVGPETAAALARGVRPVPRSTSGHLLEIDLSHQVLLVVTDGRLDAVLDTSTGSGATYVQQGQTLVAVTPPGHFTITRQVDGEDVSPLGVLWRPKYFNRGIAVHGYASVPPYPASHGCVRVSTAAIDWIWAADVAPIGTPVWVY